MIVTCIFQLGDPSSCQTRHFTSSLAGSPCVGACLAVEFVNVVEGIGESVDVDIPFLRGSENSTARLCFWVERAPTRGNKNPVVLVNSCNQPAFDSLPTVAES